MHHLLVAYSVGTLVCPHCWLSGGRHTIANEHIISRLVFQWISSVDITKIEEWIIYDRESSGITDIIISTDGSVIEKDQSHGCIFEKSIVELVQPLAPAHLNFLIMRNLEDWLTKGLVARWKQPQLLEIYYLRLHMFWRVKCKGMYKLNLCGGTGSC